MKLNKFLFLSLSVVALAGCGADDVDKNLYHLTLVADGITLTEEQKLELKATYGYGPESDHVIEGVRDPDEIAELKKAGASDADIQKAGKRQADGSYYFFAGDPIYLEAPAVEGYKMDTFLNGDKIACRTFLLTHWEDGSKYLPRYNMDDKDTVLTAKYEKWSYTISYDNVDGVTNLNSRNSYCFIDEGKQTLLPATVNDPNMEFKGWAYQDIANANNQEADWVMLEQEGDNYVLPSTYYEDYMRLAPVIEYKKFSLTFEFKHYVDPDTQNDLSYEEAGINLSIFGNLTWVDGVKADNGNNIQINETESQFVQIPTPITKDSEIVCQYAGPSSDSWINLYPVITGDYKIFAYKINDSLDHSIFNNYIDMNIVQDTKITFLLVENVD